MLQSSENYGFVLLAITLAGVAYLMGSVSPAYIVVRRRLGIDIRQVGDGNAGSENVGRLIGVRPAILVAVIDIAKGLLAVALARTMSLAVAAEFPNSLPVHPESFKQGLMLLAGVAAVLGHCWPAYLKGQGGKGAATAAGVLLGIATLPALLVALPAFCLMCIFRSTTWGLASFFIGAVSAAAIFGYYGNLGYSLAWVAWIITIPAMVGVIHLMTSRKSVGNLAAFAEK